MTLVALLFALRLLSAGLLLAFIGAVAYIAYMDLRESTRLVLDEQQAHGYLRVIRTELADLDTDVVFPLLPVTSIGRAPGNTIVLEDGYVSNQHALLARHGQQWWLQDLGSRNGTLLNEQPLTAATVVSTGDLITVGRTLLRVEKRPVG